MALNNILRGKSDEEIYQGLISSEPNDELFYKALKLKTLHLLNRLITDYEVDVVKRNLWKQIISDHKKYINDTFKNI